MGRIFQKSRKLYLLIIPISLLLIFSLTTAGDVFAGKDLPSFEPSFGVDVFAVEGSGLSTTTSAPYATVTSWSHNPVTYSLENCPANLDCGAAHTALRAAVEAWDNVCGITLNEVGAGAGDIRITFGQDTMDWGGTRLDGPGNILGYAYFPYDFLGEQAGDIYLDPDEEWVTHAPGGNQIHLQTVATHEVGHAIGLDHTYDTSAMMYAEYNGIRTLNPDDIAGAQSLYGPPSADEGGSAPAPAPAPNPEPAAPAPVGVEAMATNRLRVRSGPGTEYDIVGQLNYREVVNVIGKNIDGSWGYISYSGGNGWVSTSFLYFYGSINDVPVVGPDQPTGGNPADPGIDTGVTASTGVNLRIRSGPDVSYSYLGMFRYGTSAPVIGKNADGSWLQINYNGLVGWVAGWYCTVQGDLNAVPVTG